MNAKVRSVHLFGFFKDDDLERPEFPTAAAPSPLTPLEHFERLCRHFAHWGDDMTALRSTRTLGGLFVGAEWICPQRKGDDRDVPMWHKIVTPDETWADFPGTAAPAEVTS